MTSSTDYSAYVQPEVAPRISKVGARLGFDNYPPFLEPLLGMWSRLAAEPFVGITTDGHPQSGLYRLRPNGAPTRAAAEAATRWLDSLLPPQRAWAERPLDAPQRRHWHNTPLVLTPDLLEFDGLTKKQREGALEVVRCSLSAEGFDRVLKVMENNEILGQMMELEGLLNRRAFTLTIFGQPSTIGPWGWQLFGHHLALNALFIGDQMVISPVFLGVEPDTVDPETNRRLFQPHEQQGLAFMQALGDADRRRATLYDTMITAEQPEGRYHPDDGRQLGGAFQDNRIIAYEGLPVSVLDQAQRRKLMALAELFICNLPAGPAEASLREIESYLDETHFSWIGQANEVDPFYFRIHSPVALIEFDHHSGIFLANREPERFHVHTIVRTPNGGDYGIDLLRQHYAGSDHGRDQASSDSHAHENHDHHHEQAGHGHGLHSHDGGKTMHSHD